MTHTTHPVTATNGLVGACRIWSMPAPTAPRGILVYLDGDGQWAWGHPDSTTFLGGAVGLVATAHAHGLHAVHVRPPGAETTWWRDKARKAVYLHAALTTARDALGITALTRTVLVGYSGGAQQITQAYLPIYGPTLAWHSAAVMFGGGGAPATDAPTLGPRIQMHWVVGALDDGGTSTDGYNALADARSGHDAYTRDLACRTTLTIVDEGDHYAFHGRYGARVDALITAHRQDRP